MSGSIPANANTDSRVDQLFTALRDSKFSEATAHFDPTVKAALSADQLSQVWLQIVATDGKLENWKVVKHGVFAGIDVFSVVVAFERGKLMATVSVRPQTGEIAGLYFKPLATESGASSPATSPPYADAAKFRSEAVTVGEDPWKLRGILTIPNGSGPFPAVVLLAGSGPQDRDETIGPNHVFKDIAEGSEHARNRRASIRQTHLRVSDARSAEDHREGRGYRRRRRGGEAAADAFRSRA